MIKENTATHATIWSAASVFTKKFQKWRKDHHNSKKHHNNNNKAVPFPEGPEQNVVVSNQIDFSLARRSCDINIGPRFSLDGCRMPLEDPRYSFDDPPPRASCDTHFIGLGRRTEIVPGGTSLTREYYADSSSSRRRHQSFDHSVSIRKMTAAFIHDESVPKTEVLIEKTEIKKSRRWMNGFNIWGFIIHRRRSKKSEKTESSTGLEPEGSPVMCVSWPEVRKEEKLFNPMMLRSKSSISFRNSYELGGNGNGNGIGINGNGKKIVLERNQSARCSTRSWMGTTGSVMRMY